MRFYKTRFGNSVPERISGDKATDSDSVISRFGLRSAPVGAKRVPPARSTLVALLKELRDRFLFSLL